MVPVTYKWRITSLGNNVTWDRNSLIPNPVAGVGNVRGDISTSPLGTDVKQLIAQSQSAFQRYELVRGKQCVEEGAG